MDSVPFTIEIRPGERTNEEVGVLADGQQFWLTANLRPSSLGDDELRLLVLVVFNTTGTPQTVDVQSLGLRTEVSSEAVTDAIAASLRELGTISRVPIQVEPIDQSFLGPLFAPLQVTAEGADDLNVALCTGTIVPGWPFSSDD